MDEMGLLANCPLISVPEAAGLRHVDVTTARGNLNKRRRDGLATYHDVELTTSGGPVIYNSDGWLPGMGRCPVLSILSGFRGG